MAHSIAEKLRIMAQKSVSWHKDEFSYNILIFYTLFSHILKGWNLCGTDVGTENILYFFLHGV